MPNLSRVAVDSYRKTQAQSRTPLELVVMLYDGVLQSTMAARMAIETRNIPARRDAVSRALAIVSELQSTLDLERGAEVAESLDGLYGYITTRLMDASFRQDVGPLDEIIKLLTPLRDAWATIAADPPPPAPGAATR